MKAELHPESRGFVLWANAACCTSALRVLLATVCTPDDRKPVAVARALAAQGHVAAVAADRFLGQAGWSRFVSRRIRCPHPRDGLDAYISALRCAAAEFQADALLPLNDYATLAVSERRTEIEDLVRLAVPPHNALLISRNKFETVRLAQRIGVPVPPTWLADSSEALARISDQIRYPCVAKLVRGAGAIGMVVARSRRELLEVEISDGPPADGIFDGSAYVVQEWLQGELHDVCALFCRGEPRAALVQKRLQMYPPRGGVGVWNKTVKRPDLVERAFRLLRALAWHGPAQVEFLVDSHDKSHLIEINGRFWGTLDLAIAAGVNFPSLACEMALEGDIEPMFDYRTGVGFRWPLPLGLLAALTSERPLSSLGRLLAPNASGGKRTQSDLRLFDPAPHIAELVYLGMRALQRRSLVPGSRRPS